MPIVGKHQCWTPPPSLIFTLISLNIKTLKLILQNFILFRLNNIIGLTYVQFIDYDREKKISKSVKKWRMDVEKSSCALKPFNVIYINLSFEVWWYRGLFTWLSIQGLGVRILVRHKYSFARHQSTITTLYPGEENKNLKMAVENITWSPSSSSTS